MHNDLTQLELYHRQLLSNCKFEKAKQIRERIKEAKDFYNKMESQKEKVTQS